MKNKRLWWLLFWFVAIFLVVWALSAVPLSETVALLLKLRPADLLIWLLMNLVVVVTMTGRWWYVLEGMGYKLPLAKLTTYRLAAYGVSYFTPGPQFGGEPFLVFPVQQRHDVPTTTAIAAVSVEKALELLVNFLFLATGLLISLLGQGEKGALTYGLIPLVIGLISVPVTFLWLFWRGQQPISRLLRWLQGRISRLRLGKTLARIEEVEDGITTFCRHAPRAMRLALLGSFINWSLMLLEYWFLYYILGTPLTPLMLATAYTAARLAFLVPTPGALGALEASQVAATSLMGLDPALGFSTALLIRLRDILIGVVGLL
ncbi:MAG: flippase-like domain-containing protein, partial [Anaerolineales bacterium]|nr:flippase-like domain-containing protein [Anaerolineales bacterium]